MDSTILTAPERRRQCSEKSGIIAEMLMPGRRYSIPRGVSPGLRRAGSLAERFVPVAMTGETHLAAAEERVAGRTDHDPHGLRIVVSAAIPEPPYGC